MDKLTPICQMKDHSLGGSTTCRRESLEQKKIGDDRLRRKKEISGTPKRNLPDVREQDEGKYINIREGGVWSEMPKCQLTSTIWYHDDDNEYLIFSSGNGLRRSHQHTQARVQPKIHTTIPT